MINISSQRGRRLVVLPLLLLLFGGVLAQFEGAKPAAAATAMGSVAGFSPGAGTLWDSDADLARDLDAMVATGASWVRFDFPWSVIETQPGSFSWNLTDRAVNAATARGLRVIVVAGYTPAWARPPGADSDKFPPADPNFFVPFLRAAVQRYSTQVKVWEIWNEPNISPFWRPAPNAEAYTALLRVASAAVRSADPTATVVSGGLSPATDAADGSQINSITFLQRMYAAGAGGTFDALGMHPYSFPARPMDPSTASWNTFYRLPLVHDVMTSNGDGAKKIWSTEFGAPTGTSGQAVSEAEQASVVSDAYNAIGQWSWAGPLLWYAHRDTGTNPVDREQNFGLLRYDFSSKPALGAFSQMMGGAPTSTTVAPPTTLAPATTTVPQTTTTVAPTTTTTAPPTTVATTTTNVPPPATTVPPRKRRR